jgi:hypothetical protein
MKLCLGTNGTCARPCRPCLCAFEGRCGGRACATGAAVEGVALLEPPDDTLERPLGFVTLLNGREMPAAPVGLGEVPSPLVDQGLMSF